MLSLDLLASLILFLLQRFAYCVAEQCCHLNWSYWSLIFSFEFLFFLECFYFCGFQLENPIGFLVMICVHHTSVCVSWYFSFFCMLWCYIALSCWNLMKIFLMFFLRVCVPSEGLLTFVRLSVKVGELREYMVEMTSCAHETFVLFEQVWMQFFVYCDAALRCYPD